MTTKLKAANLNATYSADQILKTSAAGALSWGEASVSAGFDDVYSTAADATYTVPTDITKLLVFITGGGGGGASGYDGSYGWGGGAGTTVIARVTVVAADTITIAIGAGGTAASAGGNDGTIGGNSTFTHASGSGSGSMSTITAPGGIPGRFQAAVTTPTAGTVGANNEGISILGGYGNKEGLAGGGASFWGGGGTGGANGIMQSTAGTAYGSGGGGGANNVGWQVASAGAVGICFIMEFK